MGKKTEKVLTARERMLEVANQLLAKKKQASILEAEMETLVEELKTYYKATGETNLEVFTVSLRKGSAKLVGATGKALELAKSRLMEEVDSSYLKKGLDMTLIEAMHKSDNSLIGALSKYGLSVEVGEDTISFRENK